MPHVGVPSADIPPSETLEHVLGNTGGNTRKAALADFAQQLAASDAIQAPHTAANVRISALEALGVQGVHMVPGGPVVAATTGNVTLSGSYPVDGQTLADGDRYLVWQQTNPAQNGIYLYDGAGVHTRAPDMDAAGEVQGKGVFVSSGQAHKFKTFVTYSAVSSLGVDAIDWLLVSDLSSLPNAEQIAAAEQYALEAQAQAGAIQPFDSRAEFEAAFIPAVVIRAFVRTPTGYILEYLEDIGGDAATTNGGVRSWSPPVYKETPNHWAENTNPGTTDMRAACLAAWEFGPERGLSFLGETYNVGSGVDLVGKKTSGIEQYRIRAEAETRLTATAASIGVGGFVMRIRPANNSTWMEAMQFEPLEIHMSGGTTPDDTRGLWLRRHRDGNHHQPMVNGPTRPMFIEGCPQLTFFNPHTRCVARAGPNYRKVKFNSYSDVDGSTNTITAADHELSNGEEVRYYASLGGDIGPGDEVQCFVVGATADTFQLSATSGGAPINLTPQTPAKTQYVVRDGEEAKAAWTLREHNGTNCYDLTLINGQSEGGADFQFIFDMDGFDLLRLTGGHFNNCNRRIKIDMDGTAGQRNGFSLFTDNTHWDGEGACLGFLYINTPDGGSGRNIRLENWQLNGGYIRRAERLVEWGDLSGLEFFKSVQMKNINFKDIDEDGASTVPMIDLNNAPVDDPKLRFIDWDLSGNTIHDGNLFSGTAHLSPFFKIGGSQMRVCGNGLRGNWNDFGDAPFEIGANTDVVRVSNNPIDVARTVKVEVAAAATNVTVYGNNPDFFDINGDPIHGKSTPDRFDGDFETLITDASNTLLTPGSYALTGTAGSSVSIPADKSIEAVDGSTVTLTGDTTGTTRFLTVGDNVTLKDAVVNMTGTAGTTIQLMRPGDNVTMEGGVIDGGVTVSGGSEDYVAHVFEFTGALIEDFWSVGQTFKNVTRVFHRANGDANVDKHLRFIFPVVKNNTNAAFAINAPGSDAGPEGGGALDVMFIGPTMIDGLGVDAGNSENHLVGAAGVTGVRFFMPAVFGTGLGNVHFEQGTNVGVVLGSMGVYDDAKSAIFVSDNDINDGVPEACKRLAFVGGSHRRTTRGTDNAGLDLAPNGGIHPIECSLATGLIFSGWEKGGRSAEYPEGTPIFGSVFDDNGTGFNFQTPSMAFQNNAFTGNDTEIEVQSSGMIGKQYFARALGDTWDGSSEPLIQAPTVSSGHILKMEGWATSYTQTGFDLAIGGTDYPLIPIGARLRGKISVLLSKASIAKDVTANIEWDGTTLTVTDVLENTSNAIDFIAFNATGGNLNIRLNRGSLLEDCRIHLNFEGTHSWEG